MIPVNEIKACSNFYEAIKNDEQDSMISPPPPEIAMVEVVEDDEAIDDARVLTTDSDEVDFAELKKNEDEKMNGKGH